MCICVMLFCRLKASCFTHVALHFWESSVFIVLVFTALWIKFCGKPQFTSLFSCSFLFPFLQHLAPAKGWPSNPGAGLHEHHSPCPKTISEPPTTSPSSSHFCSGCLNRDCFMALYLHLFPARQTPPCPLRASWNLSLFENGPEWRSCILFPVGS